MDTKPEAPARNSPSLARQADVHRTRAAYNPALQQTPAAILADDLDQAKELLQPVEEAYRKCRDHYRVSE